MDLDSPGLFRATSRRRERRDSNCGSSIDVLLKCRIWILKSDAPDGSGTSVAGYWFSKVRSMCKCPCFFASDFSLVMFVFLATFPFLRHFFSASGNGRRSSAKQRVISSHAGTDVTFFQKGSEGCVPTSNFLHISFGMTLLTLRSSNMTESHDNIADMCATSGSGLMKKMSRRQERCLRTRYPVREYARMH